MSLIKNVGIGKRVYTFQNNIDFKALKDDYSNVLPKLKKEWEEKGLFPTQKEVDSFAMFRNEYDLEIDQIVLGFVIGGIEVKLYARQASSIVLHSFTIAKIYRYHTYINKHFYQYKNRINNTGDYQYIGMDKDSWHILQVKE